MSASKPHFKVIAGRPVSVPVDERESRLQAARRRFGKLFAHEHGSTWKPRETPLLSEWLARRLAK